jgi:hypothetical protein
MTKARARNIFVSIFLVSLAVQLICVVAVYVSGAIYPSDLTSILAKLLGIYAVPLAIIFGAVFATGKSVRRSVQISPALFGIASALVILWNLAFVWRSVLFCVAGFDARITDQTEYLVSYFDVVAGGGSFLLAGVLAFFFGKAESA